MISTQRKRVSLEVLEYSVLFLFFALYLWNVTHHYWTLPETGDPLEYLGSVTWNGVFWPWLDRIAFAVGLKAFSLIFATRSLAGMVYVGFVNTAIFLLCLVWSRRRAGFVAALFVGIIFNSSYMTLGYATYLYPNPTEALFSLLAFMAFFSRKASPRKIVLAGLFSAFAVFSKSTGIALPIVLIVFIFKRKKPGELKSYLLGGLLGTVLVFGLFVLFYDFPSLLATLTSFFHGYLGRVVSSQLSTNLASFLDVLLSALFFPVFIAAFICLSGYKDEDIKRPALTGWAYVLVIYVIYSFSKRGGLPFPHYIYSAYFYFLLGLAFYLAKVLRPDHPPVPARGVRPRSMILLGGAAFALVLLGQKIGTLYPASLKAVSFADIFPQADIFKPGYGPAIPLPVRLLYILGPLAVLGLLAFIEYSKSKKAVVALILSVSLWAPAFSGGIAYRKAADDRERADFFYKAAPLLKSVPADKFSVYVSAWSKNWECVRIPWMYGVLFDEKSDRRKNTAEAILSDFRRTNENIQYIVNPEDLGSIKWDFILTDDVPAVSKHLLQAEVVKEIRRPEIDLFVLKRGSVDLGTPAYRDDFSGWGRSAKIIGSEGDPLASPLGVGVLRGAYRFERLGEGDQDRVRISLEKRHLTERSCVQFGYYDMGARGLDLEIGPGDTVVFKIKARLSENAAGAASVFVQSRDVEWTVSSETISGSQWKEYVVFQKIAGKPKDINLGVWYISERPDEFLEIQTAQIYILPSRKTSE